MLGFKSYFKNHKLMIGILMLVIVGGVFIFNMFGKAVMAMSYGSANQDAIEVSIINLIATPEKYDGKLVRVKGVGKIKFEGNAIYLSKDDYKNSITKNALWVDPDYESLQTTESELEKNNGKYILIEGIFNSGKKGHFGLFSGTIEKISRYQPWDKK